MGNHRLATENLGPPGKPRREILGKPGCRFILRRCSRNAIRGLSDQVDKTNEVNNPKGDVGDYSDRACFHDPILALDYTNAKSINRHRSFVMSMFGAS
jgi:hypothetical protein